MNRLLAIRIVAIVGLIAAGAVATSNRAAAQTPAGQALSWQSPTLRSAASKSAPSDNQLQILPPNPSPSPTTLALPNQLQVLGIRPRRTNTQGTIRFVQNLEPLQAEPIGPGTAQGDGSTVPPSAPLPSNPQGSYEQADTGWKPIGAVSAVIAPSAGDFPVNFAATRFAQAGTVVAPINRNHDWPMLSYSWEASAVGHNPLYFEDVNLERYGYSHGFLQPLISGGRFFTTVVFLPYKIVAHPPSEIIYPLGYYRPGDPAPPVREIEPIKLSASAAEAAFIIGMIIILP